MKELFEFRINKKYKDVLPQTISGMDLGPVLKVQIDKSGSEFDIIKNLAQKIKKIEKKSFFYSWSIRRNYNNREINNAKLLHLIIDTTFEPAGEECGTLYDETVACSICGANRKQKSQLTLKRSSIPKKDITKTIAGEVIVSEKFASSLQQRKLKGIKLEPIAFTKGTSNYYQLISSAEVELSPNTVTGVDPFDFSDHSDGVEFFIGDYHYKFDRETYNCPNGDTIGLNILSEPYVLNCPAINVNDLLVSKQKIGVKRGLLRPQPLYLCSISFKQMIDDENLGGFSFEVANVE